MLEIQKQTICKCFFLLLFFTKYVYPAYNSHNFNIYEKDKVMLSWFIHGIINITRPGPKVIKCFSCSTQLSMKFIPLINVKMPTIVGI